jgi:hypothetical protein
MLKIGISILAGVLLAAGAFAEPLIKESEARLPPAAAVASRAITRGPGIRVLSPDAGSQTVTSPFQLRIAFEPRGGAKIDTATVKVTYLRNPNVDLTDRVKVGLTEKGIDLKSAEVPLGEHQIRVTVEDSEGRQSNALLNLTVVK